MVENNMKKISLISVYNKPEILSDMVKSAEKQKNVCLDFVLIDNTKMTYSSAAKALNYGVKKSVGDVLVFLHQDIEFMSEFVLEYIFDYAVKNKNTVFGAAGVAQKGTEKYEAGLLSTMWVSQDKRIDSITKPEKVFTLDECLIACHKDCFEKIRFDEELCDGWHLYGADLCLQAQDFAGFNVEVVPLDVWHKSPGNADKSYFITQNRLAKKYKKYHKVINTTNGYQYTSQPKRLLLNFIRALKYRG